MPMPYDAIYYPLAHTPLTFKKATFKKVQQTSLKREHFRIVTKKMARTAARGWSLTSACAVRLSKKRKKDREQSWLSLYFILF